MSGELDYIRWLRGRTPAHPRVAVGPGDDCAVIRLADGGQLLFSCDMLLEGSCFRLAEAGPRRVGRKALAVKLSDIAAMAGRPLAAEVSIGLPRQGGLAIAEEFYLGLREMADAFDTPLVGGDTNSWEGPLVVNVAIVGEPTGRGPVLRSGAQPGDWLFVTGPLGGSIRGKHLDFVPRVREAIALHACTNLKAMIDLSDGLAADVRHLQEESGCGVVLHAAAIPISDDARRLDDGVPLLDHALGDGEDFELLFAVSPADGRALLASQPLQGHGCTLFHIGECVDEGAWLVDAAGRRNPLPTLGYVHPLS